MGPRAAGVLFVGQDLVYREAVALVLQHQGFSVTETASGAEGLEALAQGGLDVVLIDLWVADMPGFSVCKRFRAATNLPVVVLVNGSEEVYQVAAVHSGANEAVAKPVRVAFLTERLWYWVRAPRIADGRDVGEVHIDEERREVYYRGQQVELTTREFQVLAALAASPGVVISRDTLLDRVWGLEALELEMRTVDATVARIRKKFWERFQETPIETVPGVGYRLRENRRALRGLKEATE
jgi:two-component system response regulator MtrA